MDNNDFEDMIVPLFLMVGGLGTFIAAMILL